MKFGAAKLTVQGDTITKSLIQRFLAEGFCTIIQQELAFLGDPSIYQGGISKLSIIAGAHC
ncbi:MAG: hypothetical protein FGM36_14685 [Burkholderiaceae bacterium]|nr:hypothetical protein [Burkholderiaceae bacterium]